MGKYMKKSKVGGEVAVMEVSSSSSAPHSSMGVRTRAKTLALQKSTTSPSSAASASAAEAPSSCDYIQLRSRRLQKVLVRPKHQLPTKQSDFYGAPLRSSITDCKPADADENAEFSFGENTLDAEARDRSTRESTPCSLIRDSNAIETPGSTTRQRASSFSNQIIREHIQRNIPTACEMEEFFACAEKQQQTIFMDKYNFDIVNDVPLPGRYEWVQVHH